MQYKILFVLQFLLVVAVIGLAGSVEGAVADTGAVPLRLAQKITRPSTLGSDGEHEDAFGTSVDILGDIAAIGVLDDELRATDFSSPPQGSVQMFIREGNKWRVQAKLIAGDGGPRSRFGAAVKLTQDSVWVGAPFGHGPGAVYEFVRNGTQWQERTRLTGTGNDGFGSALAINGQTLVVGAPDMASGGGVLVYRKQNGVWTLQTTLLPLDGQFFDGFGASVDFNGDRIIVGSTVVAPRPCAYVYERQGENWIETARFTVSNLVCGDSVAIHGDTAVVGAPQEDSRGAVYVFQRSGSTWFQQARLVPNDAVLFQSFGNALALSDGVLTIGASGFASTRGGTSVSGAAYVFGRNGTNWAQQAKLVVPGLVARSELGFDVAVSGNSVLLGARFDRVNDNYDQGSAHLFAGSGAAWTHTARLDSGNGTGEDTFGAAVAIDGPIALVASNNSNLREASPRGRVDAYLLDGAIWRRDATLEHLGWPSQFGKHALSLSGNTAMIGGLAMQGGEQVSFHVREGSGWRLQAVVTPPEAVAGFGDDVEIAGDFALVSHNGKVRAYRRGGEQWLLSETLNGAADEYFGSNIQLVGKTALISGITPGPLGARLGAVYIFELEAGVWTQKARLKANDEGREDGFGRDADMLGDAVLVSAPGHNAGLGVFGAAYLFVKSGDSWQQRAKVLADDQGSEFGSNVAFLGDYAFVSAARRSVGQTSLQGVVFVYRRTGDQLTFVEKMVAADGGFGDYFGGDMARSGPRLLVSAHLDDGEVPFGNPDEGAVYVFDATIFQDGFGE